MIETVVVVEKGTKYESGVGYTGAVLSRLGFPEGPYTPKIAKIFVSQARSVDSTLKFEIKPYRV
jgi:calcineurin-like phosphoesterase